MALLKALNDSCRRDVELQLQTYQLRRIEVAENKALLTQKAKAELTRPGSLAAFFTLGMLLAPGGKSKRREEERSEKRATAAQQEQAASAEQAAAEQTDVAQAAAKGEKKKKDKSFDPLDLLGSILSAVVVRLATKWVTDLATAPQGSMQHAESMPEADVDTSNQVDL